MRTQHAPYAVQIELVEGCNLFCDFCGLRGIREKAGGPYHFMHMETLHQIVTGIAAAGWNPRLEFAMHGEPTMHPDITGLLAHAREVLPSAYMLILTNGGGLVKYGINQRLAKIFAAGVNTVALDCYKYVNFTEKIRAALDPFKWDGIKFHEYPAEKDASPHTRRPGQHFIYVEDISVAAKGTHSSLNNHCGAAAPTSTKMWGKRCAKPFREMSIRWDGSVALCCNDWRGVYKIGMLAQNTMEELWQSQGFEAARKFLFRGDRGNIPVCAGCDAASYRVGLLPDPLGKETMEQPTEDDLAVVTAACSGPTLTLPVLRNWEK